MQRGVESELVYVCMYNMSVTLRNAIITMHVDTSRTRTVSRRHTRRRLCRLRAL